MQGANLRGAALRAATLRGANLSRADLSPEGADKHYPVSASLKEADLSLAILEEANLSEADLSKANLSGAFLKGANLSGAFLWAANLVHTNFTGANLTGCCVYGISAWDLKLDGAKQKDLIITDVSGFWNTPEPKITVDNLEVAQFIYLLLNNKRIRHVIDTITSKVVLILGRFTPERKAVLDALREELRQRDYLPVVFDFERPGSKSTLETVSTLAHMARFVIADLTDAKSVLQELQAVVPTNPSVPVQPLILATQEEPGMFDFFRRYSWVLKPFEYQDIAEVRSSLDRIISPAEDMACEWRGVSPPTG